MIRNVQIMIGKCLSSKIYMTNAVQYLTSNVDRVDVTSYNLI